MSNPAGKPSRTGAVPRLEEIIVGREHKARFCPGRRRAGLQRGEHLRDLAGVGNRDVDIVARKDAA